MRQAIVLTISDSSYLKMRKDLSGPAVADRLQASGWDVMGIEVLPDERIEIARRLRELCDASVGAIFTTGGTGVTARDVTPEATREVIEKELPGFGERMRLEGRKATRLADLSRATAGTRGQCIIVNLPGSPKGAVESLDAIVELVPHVLDLLRGNTSHPAEEKRP